MWLTGRNNFSTEIPGGRADQFRQTSHLGDNTRQGSSHGFSHRYTHSLISRYRYKNIHGRQKVSMISAVTREEHTVLGTAFPGQLLQGGTILAIPNNQNLQWPTDLTGCADQVADPFVPIIQPATGPDHRHPGFETKLLFGGRPEGSGKDRINPARISDYADFLWQDAEGALEMPGGIF